MVIWPLLALLQGLAYSLLREEDDFDFQVLRPLPFLWWDYCNVARHPVHL